MFAVFYGLDWIATVPPTVRLTSQAFGRENTGVVYGWIGASHQLGASLAAFGAGAIRTTLGDYRLAFWLLACCASWRDFVPDHYATNVHSGSAAEHRAGRVGRMRPAAEHMEDRGTICPVTFRVIRGPSPGRIRGRAPLASTPTLTTSSHVPLTTILLRAARAHARSRGPPFLAADTRTPRSDSRASSSS